MSTPDPDSENREAVRLRASPPRVARLSRPVILALGGLGAVAIGAAMTLALQSRSPKPVEIKTADPETRTPPAVLAEGPKTYAEVPQLGPPLPGDLGRPIVAAQARGAQVQPPAMGGDAAKPDLQVEARRRAVEAARTSGVFLSSARPIGASPTGTVGQADDPLLASANAILAAPGSPAAPSKRDFGDPSNAPPTTSAYIPAPAPGRLILQAQTVITAALVTAVNSDIPGPVSAQVTRNVYDSLTGRALLIPQGSRLIGAYDAEVAFGQRRVRLAWDRVIFPDGRSLQLDRLAGGDSLGRSGLTDRVDAHWGAMAKAALLSSTLSVGAELGSDDDGDVARALRRGVQETINQTGQQVVRQQLDVKPTLTLRPGLPLTILVTRDIVFDHGFDKGRP